MNNPEIKAFIRKEKDLFWYTPEEEIKQFLINSALDIGI
jgi:hypothetical protein